MLSSATDRVSLNLIRVSCLCGVQESNPSTIFMDEALGGCSAQGVEFLLTLMTTDPIIYALNLVQRCTRNKIYFTTCVQKYDQSTRVIKFILFEMST